MKKVLLKNTRQIKAFLATSLYKHKVVTDGWRVCVYCYDNEDIFNLGTSFGVYQKNNPEVFTIEELEQRGDITSL